MRYKRPQFGSSIHSTGRDVLVTTASLGSSTGSLSSIQRLQQVWGRNSYSCSSRSLKDNRPEFHWALSTLVLKECFVFKGTAKWLH